MTDEELIKRLRLSGYNSPTIAADRIEQLVKENTWLKTNVEEFHHGEKLWEKKLNAAEAKVYLYELKDGMDGAVVDVIRNILNTQKVPQAAFIDDHVANAIVQRNKAEAKLAKAAEALRIIAEKPIWGRKDMIQWIGNVTILAVDTLAELEKTE